MRCLVCGKRIGPARRLFDRKYCCDSHRKTARKLSARALRDSADSEELEEPWLVTAGPRNEKKQPIAGAVFSPATGILLILFITFVVLVMPSGNSAAPNAARPRPFPLSEQLQGLLRRAPASEFSEDFSSGLEEWTSGFGVAGGNSGGWGWEGTDARPAGLRLWRPTMDMTDYRVAFQGEIEAGAMSWAFRASDVGNYYAAKLLLESASANHRSEIARHSVIDGEPTRRVALPLPFRIETGVSYHVDIRVEGNMFATTINGKVVDTWHDDRHTHGGVGFFSDPGESALINWVRVTDSSGFLDRLLSFSLLVAPHDLIQPMPY